MSDASKMKFVYCVTQRGGRTFYNRIGVAFVNPDGAINVKLEALPVSGEMTIRDQTPGQQERAKRAGATDDTR